MYKFRREYRLGFTLIELLVVVAIIALLVSILLPSLNKAREAARGAVSQTNLRGIGRLQHQYAVDNRNGDFVAPFTEGYKRHKDPASHDVPAVAVWDTFNPLRVANGEPVAARNDDRVVEICEGAFYNPSNFLTAKIHGQSNQFDGKINSFLLPAQSYGMNTPMARRDASHYLDKDGVRAKYGEPSGYLSNFSHGGTWGVLGDCAIDNSTVRGHRPGMQVTGASSKIMYSESIGAMNSSGEVGYWLKEGSAVWNAEAAYDDEAKDSGLKPWGLSGVKIKPWVYTYGIDDGINAVFYDGHVENIVRSESRNANLWYPKGTELENGHLNDDSDFPEQVGGYVVQ